LSRDWVGFWIFAGCLDLFRHCDYSSADVFEFEQMKPWPNQLPEPSTLRCGHHGQREHLAVRPSWSSQARLDIRWPSAKTPAWLSFFR
jgi:hypothetical protein